MLARRDVRWDGVLVSVTPRSSAIRSYQLLAYKKIKGGGRRMDFRGSGQAGPCRGLFDGLVVRPC